MSPPHPLTRWFLPLVLFLAALLRFTNLANTPGWFSDEGTHLNLAANLLRGRAQYLALDASTLISARLPLFDLLLAGLLAVMGAGPGGDAARGMAVLRMLTASLGVLTTFLLYVVSEHLGGRRGGALGLLAALAYAVYPQAVIYNRFGFSYNLVAPLLLAALWALGGWLRAAAAGRRPIAMRWLAAAALAVGLAAVTDLWAWTLWVLLLIVAALGARRLGWAAVAPVLLAWAPVGLYAAIMLLRAPEAFLFDAGFALGRLGGRTLLQQAALLAENLLTLVAQEGWVALGMVGLFALRPARLRRLALLCFWVPLVLVGRSAALASLSFYYLIPLLPLAMLGVGALALVGLEALARLVRRLVRGWPTWVGPAAAGLLAAGVALVIAAPMASGARTGLPAAIDPFLLNPDHARQAAAFVNARAAPEDVVIASPGLAWLLTARAADFQMTLARAGLATPHLPANLPAARFAFDPGLAQARLVVVDNLWRNWAVFNVPGLAALLAEVERWPVAFTAGELTVYARDE